MAFERELEERQRERERRHKEREEKEKEWVKKAAGRDVTRNRRVFGVLLGTLQRFRKDQSASAEKVITLLRFHTFFIFFHNFSFLTRLLLPRNVRARSSQSKWKKRSRKRRRGSPRRKRNVSPRRKLNM